ncbi:5-oxoprolinase subunit C family protein [Phycicoccus flavus]|uniref:5-oxoprolinase subunit C family protein n=1 Tax=Phycicoccus flavus TaxID=2502783 RepID=UPI000FEC1F82|nr:biotin-dependent carboxyltransferase family protein [Phycicoccus flavus]NHA70313.1 biotin-dependent carboxyltransferase family protein [Phycicoccus flavus]
MRSLEVLAAGPLALVEDLGRPGLAGVGVGRSGAADRRALRLANRLLGNDEDAAAVEVTGGGLEVRAGEEALTVCVTGARGPVLIDGRDAGSHAVLTVPAGAVLALRPPGVGLRSYLGVRGGVAVEPVLGSRSHDVLSGIGPPPLAPGDVLPVGDPVGPVPGVDQVPWPRPADDLVLAAVRGPRADRFEDADVLVHTTWRVSERSNRVGMRLAGGSFRTARAEELPSEGIWRGAVQVPPGGEPVLFLADHPVTGGYPVVGVIVDADVDRAAQLPPGATFRVRWTDPP